jgi:hypothetical protein
MAVERNQGDMAHAMTVGAGARAVSLICAIIPADGLFRQRRCNGCISQRIARSGVHDWRNN